MSIYATLWTLKFPMDGDDFPGCQWIRVRAQGVPAHIGSPTLGCGYEEGDPYGSFLPPPVIVDATGYGQHLRAVVFVTENTAKGTERSAQEFEGPLLTLTGKEYARISFEDLRCRLCQVLRGNRAPIVAEILQPDGTHKIIRGRFEE